MSTSYTTLLGLALPAQGELSGSWGNEVNNYITTYLDSAIAGSLAISLTGDVTLTKTTGSVSLGSTSSQYAVLNVTPNASTWTITVPAASKIYVINNLSGSFTFTFKASGQTGVVVAVSEKCLVAFNGTDFVKIASTIVSASGLTGVVPIANGGTNSTATPTAGGAGYGTGTAHAYTAAGTSGQSLISAGASAPAFGNLGTSAGGTGLSGATPFTANGVVYASSTSALATGSGLTFDGTNFLTTGSATATGFVPSGSTVATNGMYLSAANTLNFSTNSTNRLTLTSAGYTQPVAYADTVVALGNTGTAQTITCTSANVFTATLTGNCTFTLASPIATGSSSFTLILTNDGTAGRTVAWAGGTFLFPNGSANLARTTTAGGVDVWVFFTPNGGTTWYGNISMKNMSA